MKRGRPITLSDDDLLAAAQSVFLEQGLDATTSDVARRAGISESVIFHRHKTKEALVLAVLERQMALPPELEGLTGRVGQGEIREQLHGLGLVLIEKMRTTLPFLMLAFSSPVKLNNLHERVRRFHPLYVRPLIDYLAAEVRAGRLRPVDPAILANTFFGGVREYVSAELFAGEKDSAQLPAEQYLRAMIDILLRGASERQDT